MTRTMIASALALALIAGTALAQGGTPMSIAESSARSAASQMARYDADKDGRISQKEWTDGGGPAVIFARFDADKDGAVTTEELAASSRASLTPLDLDKDGTISPDEMRAATPNMPPPGSRAPGPATVMRPGITSETLEIAGASRKITLYVPKNLPPKTAVPILLTFHGAGQKSLSVVDPWTGLADSEGFIVVGIDATYATWRMPDDGPDAIKTLVDAMRKRYSIDQSRVYVFGHSSGAVFGLKLGVMESEYFAAVAVHAGQLDQATIKLLPDAKRKTPFKIISGDRDQTVPLDGVNRTVAAIRAAGFPIDQEVIAGHDHVYYAEAQDFNKKAWQFLKGHKLARPPQWVQHSFAPSAPAPTPSPASTTGSKKFNSTETLVSTLLADPEARAILNKHSSLFQNPLFLQSKTTGAMTLRQLQKQASNRLPEEAMTAIEADLARLPERP